MVKYDYYERSAMTTLKEKISVKFEVNEYYLEDESTAYELSTGPVGYRNGYREANYQLKSEVLPILLECVEALELSVKQGYGAQGYIEENDHEGLANYYSDIIQDRENQVNKALKRLRKWSEGK